MQRQTKQWEQKQALLLLSQFSVSLNIDLDYEQKFCQSHSNQRTLWWFKLIQMQTFKNELQYIKLLLMTWIFQQCKDQLGHCIRQYVFFALSIVLSVLALYSFIKTFKSQNRFTFEVLPLAINSFTSVIIIGIYSQITFCCIILFILHLVLWVHDYGDEAKRQIRIDIEVNDSLYSRVKCIFVVITVVCVIVVAALIVLGVLDKLQCNEDQGIGAIIMLLLQLPLIALTYYFSHKCKRLLQKQSTFHRKEQLSPSIVTKHLMIQEDLYIKLKKLQLNLVRIALFITFALHITQILSFYIADSGRICRGNSLVVTTQLEIFILSVQNVTELFPHLIIPIIFWYIPFKINARSQTVFISQQQQITNSKFDQQYPRRHQEPKLKMESGDRQQSEFYKNMHSQQSIRDKLIPKTKTQRTSTL